MICLNTRYFNLNRILLLMVGLWPYKRTKLIQLQLILFYSIIISFILFQFTSFMTSECTPEFVIKVLSSICIFVIYIIKYTSFNFNMNSVKHLLEVLQYIYNELRDEGELAIMDEYGNTGRLYTIIFTLLGVFGIIFFTFLPHWSSFLNMVLPANESRSHVQLHIVTEYYVDQEKYFYLILLHTNAAYCVGEIALLAIFSMNIAYLQFVCGLFKVASYRVQQTMSIYTLDVNNIGNQKLIEHGIMCAVDIHRKAMWLVEFFISNLVLSFFLLIVIGIAGCSINLFRIFQVISSGMDFEELVLPFICVNMFYMYVIFVNGYAQQITDHNDHMFTTVYNTEWYKAPLGIQKMILFILQRGTKPFNVNLGGIFVGSLESAARLMSASMSYFTVLYSTRQN